MSPRIVQCKECKRIFQSNGGSICPSCLEEMEKDYDVIRDYLFKNPRANVLDIIRDTKTPEKTVLYFLKDGRLAVEGGHSELVCEKCKAPIAFGRFCPKCQKALEDDIARVCEINKSKMAAESKAGRMHFGRTDV